MAYIAILQKRQRDFFCEVNSCPKKLKLLLRKARVSRRDPTPNPEKYYNMTIDGSWT